MDEKYLQDLYKWIKNNDSSYEGRYDYNQFKQKMQDETYASKMHEWIGGIDNTFIERRPLNNFLQLVKGQQPAQQQPAQQQTTKIQSLTQQQPAKKKEPTVSSSEGGLSGWLGSSIEGFVEKYQPRVEEDKPEDVSAWKRKVQQGREEQKIKPALPATDYMQGYLKEEGKGVPFKEDKKYDISFLGRRTQEQIDDEVPEFIKPVIEKIDNNLLRQGKDIAKKELDYYLEDAGFKVSYEENTISDIILGVSEDSPKNAITITAPDGEVRRFKVMTDDVTEADKIKQFVKEKSNLISEKDYLYKNENRKFRSKEEIDNEVKNISNQENLMNDEYKKYLWMEKDIKYIQSELKRYKDFGEENTPKYIQTSAYLKELQDEYQALGEKVKNKASTLIDQQKQLEKAAGKYLELQSEKGTFSGALYRGFMDSAANIYSQYVRLTFSGMASIMPGSTIYSQEQFDNAYRKRLFDEGIIKRMDEPLDGVVMDKAKQAEISSQVDAELRDKFKKAGITGYYEGEKLDNVTTVNSIRENLSEFLNIPTSTTKEYKEKLEKDGSFVTRGLLGLSGSIPAMLGGPAIRTVNMFMMNTDAAMREMDNDPSFAGISENEKALVALPIGVVGAALEEIGFRNLVKGKSVTSDILKIVLGRVPSNAPASLVRKTALDVIAEMGIRGTTAYAGGILSEMETGLLQQANEYLVKDIYNTMKGNKMFDNPEFLSGQYFYDLWDASRTEGVGAGALGVPYSISAAFQKDGFQALDDTTFKIFEELTKDGDSRKFFVTSLKNKINQGEITAKQSQQMLDAYDQASGMIGRVPDEITDTKARKIAMDLISERKKLEGKREKYDDALAKPIQDKIDNINKQLTQLTQDAIQKQTTGEVSVQPEAGAGQEVEVGGPEAKPQITPEESKRKEALIAALEATDKDVIAIGDELLDRKEAQAELEAITQKEQAPVTEQGGMEQAPAKMTPEESKAKEDDIEQKRQGDLKKSPVSTFMFKKINPNGENLDVNDKQKDTIERIIQQAIEAGKTADEIVGVLNSAGYVAFYPGKTGAADVSLRTYLENRLGGTETRNVNEYASTDVHAEIETKYNAELSALQPTETTPTATPTATEATPVEQQFTEQDRARKAELEEAMRKADKRRKNITVGETTMPKAEAKAELDALNQKEQAAQQPVTPAVEAAPTVTAPTATAPVETMTAEQEADLLEELMTGKKKETAPVETAPAETAPTAEPVVTETVTEAAPVVKEAPVQPTEKKPLNFAVGGTSRGYRIWQSGQKVKEGSVESKDPRELLRNTENREITPDGSKTKIVGRIAEVREGGKVAYYAIAQAVMFDEDLRFTGLKDFVGRGGPIAVMLSFNESDNVSIDDVRAALVEKLTEVVDKSVDKITFKTNKPADLGTFEFAITTQQAPAVTPTAEVKAEPTSKEAIAKRLRGKKNKGLMSSIDFGISQALYNGALEFMASQVEKGTKLGNAIANTIKWIDEKMQGKKWNKGAFGKYMNDTYKVTLGDGRQVDVLRDDSKETAEVINGWYQPIEQRIIDSKQDKQPANKWAEQLRSKEDEDLWTGVREFLESKGNQSVSKKELLDFMKNNRVEIVEVVKGEKQKLSQEAMDDVYNNINEQLSRTNQPQEIKDFVEEKLNNWYDNPSDTNYKTLYNALGEANMNLDDFIEDAEGKMDDTKYFQYQLPGDKSNYKEVLVTMPPPQSKTPLSFKEENGLWNVYRDGKKILEGIDSLEEAKDLVDFGTDSDVTSSGQDVSKVFKSTHFDEPNILVHLRMNTRTDADGNKVLFLEEVQSDWGQQGKKQGFATTPAAPFVTDTNSWVKLGLKMALREAAAQGADKIAWTTGEQQNERYDLSKQVNKIDVEAVAEADGLYFVDIELSSGTTENLEVENGVIRGGAYNGQRLEAVIGKEYADKILSTPKGESVTLQGPDLKLGGKGMKGFYDGIVPGVAKALIKEVIGQEGKITDVNIEGNTQQAIDVTPEMKTQAKTALPLFSGSLADAVRKNLTIKTGGLQSNILGVPIAIWNAGVLTAAKAIDASVSASKAIQQGVNDVKNWIKKNNPSLSLSDAKIKNKILIDLYEGTIKTARENNVKTEGLITYFKRKGLSDAQIDVLLKDEKKKAEKPELSEETLPGYTKLMNRINDIIARGRRNGKTDDDIMKGVIANVESRSPEYANATDQQREQIIRDIRKLFGKKEKAAPSAAKITGKAKPKKVTVDEMTALKDQLRIEAKAAREAKGDINTKRKMLADAINKMVKKGSITVRQAKILIDRVNSVNLDNPVMVERLLDYAEKVFNDAEYAEKIERINSLLGKAKENVKTKIGVSEGLTALMNKLFSINPNIIPAEIFEAYSEIVEMMGKRQAVLTLKEANELTKDVEKVLDVITDELSNLDELIDIFDNYENKVIDKDGKIDFSATLDKMLEDGTITPNDVKLYKKYKNKVLPREAKEKKTEQQLAEEKKELIDAIRQTQVDESNLNMREERDAARNLISAMTPENLNGLTNAELANLLKVLDNINNGFFPHYAVKMTQKLNATNRKETLGGAIKTAGRLPLTKLIANIKSLFPGAKSANMIMVIESPKYVIDQVFGFFKKSPIYDSVFKPLTQAFATYKTDARKVKEKLDRAFNKVARSYMNNPVKIKMSQFKMMTYALQLEYQSNKDKGEGFYSAAEYIKETIKHARGDQNTMSKKDIKLLEKVLELYGVKDADGNVTDINIDKLYDSFNNAEKQAIETIQEVNTSIRDKAMFTAAVIRGDKMKPIDNYIHHNVLPTGVDDKKITSVYEDMNARMMPSTKATTLEERTKGAKPLNFNIFGATQRSANQVLMDFHLTETVRTSRMVLNELGKDLKKNGSDKELSIFNAINESFKKTLENTLTNTFNDSTFADKTISMITKQSYRVLLAGASRWTAELISNLAYATLANPKAYMNGITKYRKFVMSEKGPAILQNIGSAVQDRIYEDSVLSGRMIDGSIMDEAIGLDGTTSNYMVSNAMQTIYNNTAKKVQNFVSVTADTLISTPDKIALRPFYFGVFAQNFKKETGQDVDFDKIAANDEAYLSKFKEAIDKSKDAADNQAMLAGGTKNPFAARQKAMTVKGASAFSQIYQSFNNFMNNFIINEYIAARTGIYAMMGNGKISQRQGAAVLAGVVTRTTLYSLLVKELAAGFAWLFLGDDDEEDEEKEEKSLIEKSGQAFAGSMTSLILGRDFGNLTRNMINYGVEKVNENYVQKMIDGKYTKEDVIAFNSLIPSSLGSRPQFSDLLINMSGAGQPFLRSAKTLYETYFADEPKNEDTIKKRQNYWRYTLPLEIAGHLGFVPLYKDVKSVTNKALQREVDKIKSEKEGAISKQDAYKNYETLEEFQLADPEGYDEYSKDGGLLDQYRKQQREKKEENKSEKEKELDVKYGRLPFKENSMREEAMQGYPTIEQMKEENPDLYDQLSEEGGALYNLRQHEKRMKELRENALGGYGSEADFKALNPTKYEKYISEGGLLYKYNKIKQVFKADASEKMSEAQYKRRYPKEYRENYGYGSNYQLESYDRKAKKRADEREKMKEARSYGY